MNTKTKIAFLKWAALFVLLALIVAKVYDIGLHRPPLKYANIPTSTQDYLRNLGKNTKDQGITYSDQGPFNWNNNDNRRTRLGIMKKTKTSSSITTMTKKRFGKHMRRESYTMPVKTSTISKTSLTPTSTQRI